MNPNTSTVSLYSANRPVGQFGGTALRVNSMQMGKEREHRLKGHWNITFNRGFW